MNNPTVAGTVRYSLREATAKRHATVDRLFGGLDLSRRADYVMLLRAHARCVPALEQAADPAWSVRAPLLLADLETLGEMPPPPLSFRAEDEAERWGVRYVLEGSRLGGAMLARGVAADLPRAYLSAAHEPGNWRAFQQALDQAAGDAVWIAAAVDAADRAFGLFEVAFLADRGSAS